MRLKTYLKKNDIVEVISGEEKGKRGKIIKMLYEKDKNMVRAIVEGVNLHKKHQKPRGADQPGGIIDIPLPLPVCKLALICPKCGQKTKVKREKIEGKRVRICKKCNEIID
uniref:Large ribosomal subunit protein uL24 n=1 Tax=candidate division WOR-3 bacterium TaxID=2052148 RepID=A0A7V4E4K9_UNCW3